MTHGRSVLMLLAVGCGLAGCAGVTFLSPNDAQYAQSGAPHAGEPPPPQGDAYVPLGGSGGGGGGGGM